MRGFSKTVAVGFIVASALSFVPPRAVMAQQAASGESREEVSTQVRKLPKSAEAERRLLTQQNDTTAHLEAARAHIAEGANQPSKLLAARRHVTAILNSEPENIEALLLAGHLSLLEGDAIRAAHYYRNATLANDSSARAHLGLGDALTRLGDEPGAAAAFARYRALRGMPPLDDRH